jgi:hypothetical protein
MFSQSQINPSQNAMRQILKSVFVISNLSFALFSPSFADDAADVGKLLRAGQISEALQK